MLNKKLKEKEEEYQMKTKLFDTIIEDYKRKMENLITVNENTINKYKELEFSYKTANENEKQLQQEIENINSEKSTYETHLKNMKINFEIEINEKKKLEEKNGEMYIFIKQLVQKMNKLYKDDTIKREENKKYFDKINNFFVPIHLETSQLSSTENNQLDINK